MMRKRNGEDMKQKEDAAWKIWWLLIPLFLYYIVNNLAVLMGNQMLEVWIENSKAKSDAWEMYLNTAVKMAGMFLGGVAVYPFYQKVSLCCIPTERAEKFGGKEIVLVTVSGILLGTGLNFFFFLLGITQSSEEYTKVAESQFGLPIWLAVVFYGILSPVIEEMVFRGIVYRGLKYNIGRSGAILGSALLFGVFHGNIVQMVYGSIMGIVLAIYYEKYKKAAAPILFHSAANIAVYLLSSL